MAYKIAIASGDWDNPAIWDDGVVPTTGDDVYANGYTITINQNITVNNLLNTAVPWILPYTATATMTDFAAPSGVTSSSSTLGTQYPWKAFNKNTGDYWQSNVNNSGWIKYQFPTAKTIVRYAFLTYSNNIYSPYTWTFEASNDNTNWTVLESITGYTISNSQWYISPVISNTTAYLYYRINVTAVTSGVNTPVINEIEFTESSAAPYGTVAGKTTGGSFSLTGSYTVSLTAGIYSITTGGCLVYSGGSGINATINFQQLYASIGGANVIVHSGTGTLNVTGNTNVAAGGYSEKGIYITSSGTLNYTNNLYSGGAGTANIYVQGAGSTINVIGDFLSSQSCVTIANSCTFNLTGALYGAINTTYNHFTISGGSPIINVTGNVYATVAMALTTGVGITANITGNVYASASNYGIGLSGASTLTIVGTLFPSTVYPAFYNVATSSLSYVSGNLTNNAGVMVFHAARVVFTTISRTWTFQKVGLTDKILYTSDQVPSGSGSYPLVANVRSGISYGLGAYTGTMVIPAYQNVAYGVDVDNAKGVAYLSAASTNDIAAAVWNQLNANITTTGSIGERLKNASTVYTTGQQLAGFDI